MKQAWGRDAREAREAWSADPGIQDDHDRT